MPGTSVCIVATERKQDCYTVRAGLELGPQELSLKPTAELAQREHCYLSLNQEGGDQEAASGMVGLHQKEKKTKMEALPVTCTLGPLVLTYRSTAAFANIKNKSQPHLAPTF